jgi:hypothetical protein
VLLLAIWSTDLLWQVLQLPDTEPWSIATADQLVGWWQSSQVLVLDI